MMLFLLSEAIKKERENTLKKGCQKNHKSCTTSLSTRQSWWHLVEDLSPSLSHTQTHTVLLIHRVLTSKKNSEENKILDGGRNGLRKCWRLNSGIGIFIFVRRTEIAAAEERRERYILFVSIF